MSKYLYFSIDRQTDRMNKHRPTDRATVWTNTDRPSDRMNEQQPNERTNKQTSTQTNEQTNKQTNKQTKQIIKNMFQRNIVLDETKKEGFLGVLYNYGSKECSIHNIKTCIHNKNKFVQCGLYNTCSAKLFCLRIVALYIV